MTNAPASTATPNRRRTTSAPTEPSAAPDSVVVGVRRSGHVHGLVVEVRHLDPVGAGKLEDLGGAGDARQVRAVADLPAVALELGEKLLCPSDFVLRRGQSLVDDGTLIWIEADLAGHPELHRHRG